MNPACGFRLPLTVVLLAMFLSASGSTVFASADYVVKAGDTLSDIAREQLGSARLWHKIATDNNLEEPYTLTVGQHLILTAGEAASISGHEVVVRQKIKLPSTAESKALSSRESVPGFILFFVAVLGSWISWVLCLRVSCWLARVEVSLWQCSTWVVYMHCVLIVFVAVFFMLFKVFETNTLAWEWILGGVIGLFLFII